MILDRPRGIRELVAEAVVLYLRDWPTYLLLAALVIVPSNLLVLGAGLGQLGAPYAEPLSEGDQIITALLTIVTVSLTGAMAISVLVGRLSDESVPLRQAVRSGLDVFAPVLLAMVLVVAATVAGLFAFVIPGLVLAVRLSVVLPAAVVERRQGLEALRRAWHLTKGSAWRTLGTLVCVALPAIGVGIAVGLPADVLARDADAYGIVLAAAIVGDVLTAPYLVIAITLLFGDLRARRAAEEAAADPAAAA